MTIDIEAAKARARRVIDLGVVWAEGEAADNANDVLALAEEVERLTQERDAARAALRSIADAGGNGKWEPSDGVPSGSDEENIWDDGYSEGLRVQGITARAAVPATPAPEGGE